jgi:predicted enzyme related to lactoylglutathione lyase
MGPSRHRAPLLAACAIVGAALIAPSRSEAAGEIYWFALQSEDVFTAIRFYQGLFGWEIDTGPAGNFLMRRNGVPFASIAQIEDRIPNVSESTWLAAINVLDVKKAVATAASLGASIRTDVTELPGWGRFAVLQDPDGAPLILAQPQRPLGGNLGYSGWRWAELWSHDPAKAQSFYTKVIGYTPQVVKPGGQPYTVFDTAGKHRAGLMKLQQKEIPSRWMPYVGVSDLKGILVRVWQNGGKVLREPAEIDKPAAGTNRVALIADPTGGALFLYQLDERATADPAAIADSNAANMRVKRDEPVADSGGGNFNVSFSLSYSTGFGPGWGTMYPVIPGGGFGPY